MQTMTLKKMFRRGEYSPATKEVSHGDPVWNDITQRRERFHSVEPDGMVQTMRDNGKPYADLWHPTQLVAY
jgi:hypothetical protein